VNPYLYPSLQILGDGEQLDLVSEFASIPNIERRNRSDSLHMDPVEVYISPIGDGGENLKFVGGIQSIYIQGGIGLRVPFILRLPQGRGKISPLLRHLGKDVIGRSVDDAHHEEDPIGH
jgi:hypothetical protein